MPPGAAHNPFSTRYLGPKGMDYLFSDGESLEHFLAPLRNNGWRAELVAPQGHGKSTLLNTLRKVAEEDGKRVACYRVYEERPRLPVFWKWRWRAFDLVLIDSAELLKPRVIEALHDFAIARGLGLIVTTHRPLGFDLQCHMKAREETVEAIVERLLAREEMTDKEMADWRGRGRDALLRANGDMRTALFALYDQWEDSAKNQTL